MMPYNNHDLVRQHQAEMRQQRAELREAKRVLQEQRRAEKAAEGRVRLDWLAPLRRVAQALHLHTSSAGGY